MQPRACRRETAERGGRPAGSLTAVHDDAETARRTDDRTGTGGLRVVAAPDSFKGSASAAQVAEALAAGARAALGDSARIRAIPFADGGEGTLDAVLDAWGVVPGTCGTTDAHGRPVTARYGVSPDGRTVLVEAAEAYGLPLVADSRPRPLAASSHGVGTLALAALAAAPAATEVVLFVGGSATTDGGAGLPDGRPDGRPWTITPPVSFDQPLEVDLSLDTVVIAGHGAGPQPNLAALPTVAEPTAPQPANPLHPLALPLLRPQQVIMLGRPTLHRPVSALLADPSVPVFALTTGPRWPDVSGNSQATGTRAVTAGEPSPAWLRRCAEVNGHAVDAVRGQLKAHPLTTGLHVAAEVADALRDGDQLVLGASNPVRDVALVGLAGTGAPRAVTVRSNRGVAGIDGTVSTAIGAALAHERATGGRTVALIGDLTFVHDSSGLLIGPTEPTPRRLTIVVSNDNGGGIFELLEQGDPRFSDVSSRIFGTPHDVDIAALCRAYHVEYREVEAAGLTGVLDEPHDGMRVVEVKADRSSLRKLHASIKAAL